MPKVGFTCRCANECVALGIERGMTFSGTACIDEYGEITFIIDLQTAGPFKCHQQWFTNYFRIIE